MEKDLITVTGVGVPFQAESKSLLEFALKTFINSSKQNKSIIRSDVCREWAYSPGKVVARLDQSQKDKLITAVAEFPKKLRFGARGIESFARGYNSVAVKYPPSALKELKDSIEAVLDELFLSDVKAMKAKHERERLEEVKRNKAAREALAARRKMLERQELEEAKALLKRNGFAVTKNVKTKASTK